MKPLILASKSPRRQELLKLCGFPFTVETVTIDESTVTNDFKRTILPTLAKTPNPADRYRPLVESLALAKAAALHSPAVVLGSDTLVLLEEEILGKPADAADASRMLHLLAGKTHHVLSGVAICDGPHQETFSVSTAVTFHPLDAFMDERIASYVRTGSPLDKAGAYGIQDEGALFVKEIHGDFYTVVGLPIAEVSRHLAKIL